MAYSKQKPRSKEHCKFTADKNGNIEFYGGGTASDLTGAKTKICYICLRCIALTFTKLSQCQSWLKSTLASAQLSDKPQ